MQIRGSTRGLTLLELAVVLALIGAISAGGMMTLTASVASSQVNATVARMQAIDTALLNFRTAFTRLPCPGDLTLTSSSANYGLEADAGAGSTNAVGSGTCTGASSTPAANFAAAGTNTNGYAYTVAEGSVPTRALWLPDSYMYDGWGHKFRYAVDAAFTATSAFTTYPPICSPLAYGGITVKDSTGAARSSVSVYALISHGANGHGAYTAGGAIVNGGSANADELTNCNCGSTGAHTGGAGVFTSTFVQKLPATTTVGNGLTVFDDIVDFRERWQMQAPTGDTAGQCTYIYVVDGSNRVQKFNSINGSYISQLGSCASGACTAGSSNGAFTDPRDIAFDASGNIWVSDSTNNRIEQFNRSGTYLMGIGAGYNGVSGAIGSAGTLSGQFNGPRGVVVDSSGNIWVGDYFNNRVQKFNSSGSYQTSIGAGYNGVSGAICSSGSGNGQFNGAHNVRFDSSGSIWVSDQFVNRMQKFNSSGTFLMGIGAGYNGVSGAIGTAGTGVGQLNNPTDQAFDSGGNIWVADNGNNRVQEFNSSGTYLFGRAGYNGVSGAIGSTGTGSGQFYNESRIAFDTSGSIWVADSINNRMEKFNSSGTFLMGIGAGYNGVSGAIGSTGTGNSQFVSSWGVAIGSR